MIAVFGILLLVAGAVIAFAIDRSVEGVDLVNLGYILMAGGGLALIVAAVKGLGMVSTGSTTVHSERHVSSDGRHLVEETQAS